LSYLISLVPGERFELPTNGLQNSESGFARSNKKTIKTIRCFSKAPYEVPFSCRKMLQRLPLIFKGFHVVAAVPRDMKRDMGSSQLGRQRLPA
jgi:hypothetical protein